jgi:predicted transglutaminase-like cysteine proteinase
MYSERWVPFASSQKHRCLCSDPFNQFTTASPKREDVVSLMSITLPNIVRGKLALLVTGVVMGAFVLAVPAAATPTFPQASHGVSFDAGDLAAAAFVDAPPHTGQQDGTTGNTRQGMPIFGMETEPVDGDVAAKWRVVAFDIDAEQQVLARCRSGEACPVAARSLMDIVAEGAGRVGLARVGFINRAVDLAIAPASDKAQWGVADHWSPPFETLKTQRGDCEDYAIVKYLALLEAGLSRDDVKVVILRNLLPNEDHAVVAARVDGKWLILDNLRLALVRDTEMVGSIPKFVLDEHGVRRLIPSNADRTAPATALSGTRRLLRAA